MAPTEQQYKQSKAQQLAGIKKAPKARIQRYLKRVIEPSIKETRKLTLLFKGISCSESMILVLKELKTLFAPHSKLLQRNNNVIAFDDDKHNIAPKGEQSSSIEFLCTKNDCSLFAMATHNKKRPNNLIIGRTHNHFILDRVELGITYFKSMKDYYTSLSKIDNHDDIFKKRIGSKPLLLFVGDIWNIQNNYQQLQNLFIDFYRGDVIDQIIPTGIDHIIMFTVAQKNDGNIIIHQRTYFIQLISKNTNNNDNDRNVPTPELTPCGPDFDFILRRTLWADPIMAQQARKLPTKTAKKATITTKSLQSKHKNQSTNIFGETIGRLHMNKQVLDGKQTGKKMKSLTRAERDLNNIEKEHLENELKQEMDHEDEE